MAPPCNTSYCLHHVWTQPLSQDNVDLLRDVAERRRRTLGETHPETRLALNAKFLALTQLGGATEAAKAAVELKLARQAAQGRDHPEAIDALRNVVLWWDKVRSGPRLCHACTDHLLSHLPALDLQQDHGALSAHAGNP